MPHAFVTIVIPVEGRRADDIDDVLRSLQEPGQGNRPKAEIEDRLRHTELIHFLTITLARTGSPAEHYPQAPTGTAHLLIEISADYGGAEAIDRLAIALEPELNRLLRAAGVALREPLTAFLRRHNRQIGDSWFADALGQVFGGSPGMTVERIVREEQLAKGIASLIDHARASARWHERSPRQQLDYIRDVLWEKGETKWAFVPEAAPCLIGDPHNKWNSTFSPLNPQLWKAAGTILVKLLWPVWLILLLALGLGIAKMKLLFVTEGIGAVLKWLGVVIAVLVVAGVIGYLRLRHLERHDEVEDLIPPERQAAELMAVENFGAQNHLASISRLKPGWLRKLTLRLAFVFVGTGRFLGPPGFLGKNGVIHFARWMRLPGTDQLLFWSNYDGTWEAYVGDFIADAPSGVTGIWSNCLGFPRSEGLFRKGATNRDRLVNWARRQQHPTLFFYSTYRDLTAARIRTNAAIRQGLASAESDADARDWLALFGSAYRPAQRLETGQIPTLLFGGLSPLRFAACYVIAFHGSVSVAQCRAWLGTVSMQASYGELLPGQKSAVIVGLAATGLRKLGLPEDALGTFPVAFQQGMHHPDRARMMGDQSRNHPDRWAWGSSAKLRADAVLLVYGASQSEMEEAARPLLEQANAIGRVHSVPMKPLDEKRKGKAAGANACPHPVDRADKTDTRRAEAGDHADDRMSETPGEAKYYPSEPFGFADGISQPIIHGAPGWSAKAHGDQLIPPLHSPLPGKEIQSRTRLTASDVVEPGELILGYPDNIGTIPPAPSIAASDDPNHMLPDAGPDPFRRRPEFSRYQGSGRRDLGFNGTYIVIRQLEQDVTRFNAWLDKLADDLLDNAVVAQDKRSVAIVWGAKEQDAAQAAISRPRRHNVSSITARGRQRLKEAIAAKLVGRWQDGTSLVRCPVTPGSEQQSPSAPDNDFLFGIEDPSGYACPLGSHIRRANPRDARFPGEEQEIATTNRHRILRVGRFYEDMTGHERKEGLVFMCLNADIARQFEFIQKTWLLNPNMHGLQNEVDPILGSGEEKSFTLPTPTGSIRIDGVPDVVRVIGGGYFFLPGRAVLNYLAQSDCASAR
ncbi:MAG TPA: hypothetical protein VFB54_03185 [Burkholderiales bacterium]|nr:hypothetical protein [Burkholderiales bacterium]